MALRRSVQLAEPHGTRVAERIVGTTLGREDIAYDTVRQEIAGAAVIFCCQVAPNAPEAILREASIRLAGWLYGNRPHVAEHTLKDSSGVEISLRFNNSAATANGFRASGASSLLIALHRAPGRSDRQRRCNPGVCG